MPAPDPSSRADYNAARDAFSALDASDKVAFVFEAAFGALGDAFVQTGRQMADAMEGIFSDDFWTHAGSEEAAASADPAKPPTAKTKAPRKTTARSKTAGTAQKKTAPKKTTRKKKDDE